MNRIASLGTATPGIAAALFCAAILAGATYAQALPQQEKYPDLPSETPAHLQQSTTGFDFERRDVMIPMRDGVKLHTIILVPKGAKNAPILLTRTPYDANGLVTHRASSHLGPVLDGYDNAVDVIVEDGYIRVVQDVRGKYGSEGDYVMTRPLHGPLNSTPVDHSTDTYDTIDWLVKNIPESNGKVGILGISYDGFLPLMALVNPHPALKVAVPMNPMVDGWRGDDWFHNGAFREQNMPYIYEQEATRDNTAKWWTTAFDDYDVYIARGLRGRTRPATRHGADRLLAKNRRAPCLRFLVAAPGHGQNPGSPTAESSHHAGGQPLGSGRHLRRARASIKPGSRKIRATTNFSWFSARGITARKFWKAVRSARFVSRATPPSIFGRIFFDRSLRAI